MSDQPDGAESKTAKPAVENSGWRVVDFSKLKNPPVAFAAGVYLIVTIIGGASLIAGLGAFFVLGYDMFFADAKDRIEGAKVFFSVLVALIGGPVLIWRALTAHWAAQAARHQADTAREGHYTDLFTKAVEQLGATREVKETIEINSEYGVSKRETITKTEPNLEVRLGAIYALDRVARDSERDHWPIMQVLCAYVRNPQNTGPPIARPVGAEPGSSEFAAWSLSIQLPRMDVQAALKVIGARPEHRRNLEASRNLLLDLRRANLQRAVLDGGHFEQAMFGGAHLDRASFFEGHLQRALFDDAHLAAASFYHAHLDGAHFYEADLRRASFQMARLADAAFPGANLAGAQLTGSQLARAEFWHTHLAGASFDRAHLAGTELFQADLSQAQKLNAAALATALGDGTTKLPEGTERPAVWPDSVLSETERAQWRMKAREMGSKET